MVFFVRREHTLDFFLLLPLLTFFLALSSLFFPTMVGEGLLFVVKQNIKTPYLVALLPLSLLATLMGCFRISLKAPTLHLVNKITNTLGGPLVGKEEEEEEENEHQPHPHHDHDEHHKCEQAEEKRPPLFPTKSIISQKKKAPTKVVLKTQKSKTPIPYDDLIKCLGRREKDSINMEPDKGYFEEIMAKIEDKLSEFNIDAKVIHILKGPVVDTFELELGEGVRVARITSLSEDLGLALSGVPLRIIYPMEGKTTVGIEVPRNPRKLIFVDEVFRSKSFQNAQHSIPLAIGKNSFGDPCVVDLTKMPHMLVAGATGAGKSVFINTLLLSLLVKMPPEKLKLILIDPKQLELALYRNLPHLIMPVITHPSEAVVSLMWAVEEMERRYSILSQLEVRSIEGFNEKIKTASPETLSKLNEFYEGVEDKGYELPYLVIVVDEFADLILVKNGKAIEGHICRLAAKARACGIHLIIATQRPSVDVITGLIKANFPTRVSFRVTSGQDSRTILNSIGAENLLGKGDMLYKHGIEMRRLHASYVNEDQIALVVNKISTSEPTFSKDVLEYLESKTRADLTSSPRWGEGGEFGSEQNGQAPTGGTSDPLYQQAVNIVTESRSASASMIQRRLKIGYNRAANLIESMEDAGVVGPQQGSKPRQVLLPS